MNDAFWFERGKVLFNQSETGDPLSAGERSKSDEHSVWERSKNVSDINFEKAQKLKENEEK